MMNFTWRSRRAIAYESLRWQGSRTLPNVSFGVRKVSLESKLQLITQIRALCLKHEFLRAGDTADQIEASISDLLVKKLYLEWGLFGIRGLMINGKPATVDTLIHSGPEVLADEIVEQIRHELGLTEEERKNS